MEARERTTESLVKAGATIIYCTSYAQTKGTSKEKCKSARIHLALEFPGVSDDVIADIERLGLAAMSNTLRY